MWNYNFAIPGFMVVAVLFLYFIKTPRLNIRLNRSFLELLALEVLTVAVDYTATRADEHYEAFAPSWLFFLNAAYFALYLARAFWYFRISWDVLHLKKENTPNVLLYWGVFALSELIVISSFFTGAVFRIGETGYQRGPLYAVIYLCWIYYLVVSVALLRIYSDRLNRYELVGGMAYNAILLVGNVVRYLMPKYLIMNTFCLLAILVIYLTFAVPERHLANRRIAFNMRAFREALDDTVGEKPYRVLAFALQDYIDTREIYGGTQMDHGVDMVARFLTQAFPECQVFYLRSGYFALLGAETMPWEKMRDMINERFQSPWSASDAELYLAAAFVTVSSRGKLDTPDKVTNNLVSGLARAAQAVDGLIDLDGELELDRQTEVKRSLEFALEQGRVDVFLQPLVDSKTYRITGAEVLARIRDAEGNIIPPSLFIPIAEKNGKINLMGERVFELTCRFIHDNDMEALGLSWLNVNLSPIQCMRSDLSSRFLDILNEYGVSPQSIRLEITEQAVVDIPLLERQIETLRDNGFRFSLDDYGSGYSNLNRVKHYPFVNIKLDMEVVWDYFRDRDHLLPNIVHAFKEMGYTVTAEGIESGEMAEVMASIGCDYLQGFYFSKPLSTDAFIRKYAKGSVP
ncbi:MAG: EAL domain-containing protein [Ruminococcaceae bacterium]|nr:EAL domain-containing protein [Oscillospiraceae bacterium]